ncbi:MAG: hypothetical protein JW839_05080 [Candidatus Lokiarchaeota archaeon]|nr:hypothetical protein [Candidatus Lokiarchaeota archaeon]
MENPTPTSNTTKHPSDALRIATIGMYAASCIGAGYMFTIIPNVEIFSMLVFLGGLLFGRVVGLLNGFIAALIYFLFNIFGASPPMLLGVQLAAYTLLGLMGGVMRPTRLRRSISPASQAVFAIIGAAFSFAYTFVADVSFALSLGMNFVAWFLQGLVFTIISIVCNVLTFGFLLPLLVVSLDKHLQRMFPLASAGV